MAHNLLMAQTGIFLAFRQLPGTKFAGSRKVAEELSSLSLPVIQVEFPCGFLLALRLAAAEVIM